MRIAVVSEGLHPELSGVTVARHIVGELRVSSRRTSGMTTADIVRSMRLPGWLSVLWLAGCSIPNPFFAVASDSDSAGGMTGTSVAGTQDSAQGPTTSSTSVTTGSASDEPPLTGGAAGTSTGAAATSPGSSGESTGAVGTCGNNDLEAGEECDDGDLDDGDGCSKTCTFDQRVVFVTEASWAGNDIGGVNGADKKCTDAAALIPELDGMKFRAWVSSADESAFSRMGLITAMPYVRRDGETVAAGTAAFALAMLKVPINVTEKGTGLADADCASGTNLVWTGTESTGAAASDTCSGWSLAGQNGKAGNLSSVGVNWTACKIKSCVSLARLYCFQVAN
jgi:cysteine-rich repeat protein